MKYPFDTSEKLIYDFEALLKESGIKIETGSDLEKISLAILETNSKHKKEIVHDNSVDIRDLFSDVAGLVDFAGKIVKNKTHPDFKQLIPHLKLLNKAETAVLTTKSKITDEGNNKLMELYIALLCMRFSTNIKLDDPNNSKGNNPDIMFTYRNKEWAIACKASHSAKEKTLYDNIDKGTEQIDRSKAEKGLVVVNFKNIINRNQIWPLLNEEEFQKGEEPVFGCHPTIDTPSKILQSYGHDYQKKLLELIGAEHLIAISKGGKCPSGFLIFLQAMTSIIHNGECLATILKTFNLVQFDNVGNDYKQLSEDLNEAMHDRI
jgi:hypothetical protein